MTSTATDTGPALDRRTARSTGLPYLGLAVCGAAGFLVIRSRLYLPDDAAGTLANLRADPGLARAGVAFELATVLTQALVAVGFLRLFRGIDLVGAWCIAAFGLMNAAAVLVSAAALGAAAEIATGGTGVTDAAAAVQLLSLVSAQLWTVGALFFGLWLVPMGRCATRASLPRLLGPLLVVGGVGYVLSAFVATLLPDVPILRDVLTLPATAGEFWMIGVLLVGLRTRSAAAASHPVMVT